MRRSPVCVVALGIAALLAGSSESGARAIESRPVHFAKGTASATLKGSLRGDQTIDYRLGVRSGQELGVELRTDNAANYFNVLPPGSNDVAIFTGSTSGGDWRGKLAVDGEYVVRVYLMRSAARRNETANYTLTIGITGTASAAGAPGTAPATDAKVGGTPYHATGTVGCSMGNAPPGSSQCRFGVIRGASGDAEVHLTPSGGLERVLRFSGRKVSAGEGATVKATRHEDHWLIDVNDYEHYRIPDAVIDGG